mgnify:CR=1 FL=1
MLLTSDGDEVPDVSCHLIVSVFIFITTLPAGGLGCTVSPDTHWSGLDTDAGTLAQLLGASSQIEQITLFGATAIMLLMDETLEDRQSEFMVPQSRIKTSITSSKLICKTLNRAPTALNTIKISS